MADDILDSLVIGGGDVNLHVRRVLLATGLVDERPDEEAAGDALSSQAIRNCPIGDRLEPHSQRLTPFTDQSR